MRYFGDVQRSYHVILVCGGVGAMLIGLIWLVLLRWERLAFDRDDGVASTTRGRSREHDDGIAVVSGRSNRRDRVDGVARDATAATAVSLSATPR